MFVFQIILFMFYITVSQCRLPDKVYCVNKECSEPISKAKTLIKYNTGDEDLMSFRSNADAIVYMKSAGINPDLWYVTIDGRSGLVNSRFLKELKIYDKNLQIVPYEVQKNTQDTPIVKPDKVLQAHEVIEGTTIYSTERASPELSSTTETPSNPLQDTTPQIAPNEQPMLTSETPSYFNTSNMQESENLAPQIEYSDFPPSNNSETVNLNSVPNNELKTNSDINDMPINTQKSSETDNIKGEVNLNAQEMNQVIMNPLTEPLIDNPLISFSENLEVPETADDVQNTIIHDSSKSIKVSNPSPSTTVDNSRPIQISDNILDNTSVDNDLNETSETTEETLVDNDIDEPTLYPQIPSGNDKSLFNFSQDTPPSDKDLNDEKQSSVENEYSGATNIEPPNINDAKSAIMTDEQGPVQRIYDSVPPNEVVNDGIGILTKNEPIELIKEEHNFNPEQPLATQETVPTFEEMKEEVLSDTDATDESNADHQKIAEIPIPTSNEAPPIYLDPLPSTTETLPPIFHTQTEVSDSPLNEGIPDVYSYTISTETIKESDVKPDQTFYSTSEEPPSKQDKVYTETTPAPTDEVYSSTMENPSLVEELSSNIPPVEDPSAKDGSPMSEEESKEGFLSSVYSTLSDVWPSTTETPPSLFNTEAYLTFEEEKADGKEGFSFMSYIMSTYYSVMGVNDEIKALFPSHGETCYTDEYCDGKGIENNRFLTFIVTAASSVLLFTLGYYYIDNKRQDSKLIGKINSLQRDLLFSTKECEILKEELSTTKNKLAGIEDSSFGMDDMVKSLKEEINELKATNERLRNSLDDNEKLLRVSENTAGELQNTLGDVENTLSELLAERANYEEQIHELNDKVQAFEEELISVSRERDNYHLKYVSAETALEETIRFKKQNDEISQQLMEAKNTIELQKHELLALKDAIKDLKSGASTGGDAKSLIDYTEIKAKLSKALEERHSLANKYETEHNERKKLSEELETTQESLRTTSQQASEALTRLEVLGKYFQEREGELLKELSSKESLWLSKQGESATTVEKIELLQQEVQRFKEKCDALTLELAEQESSRRTAVGEIEARAHAAWLEARTARREADAAREEAATLRRKLASISTHSAADGAVSPHHKVSSPLDLADVSLPPPLPLAFFPPPPLLPPPPLPRPPPLGRLPSPHPPRYGERRYSPDSRYSPESRYSPVSRFSPESRYSPETVRYSPDSRYSPRPRREAYSPRSRRRSSRDRYEAGRGSRTRNGPADTETEYNSDSPPREPRRRRRYSRHSGPSSGSGCSTESDK